MWLKHCKNYILLPEMMGAAEYKKQRNNMNCTRIMRNCFMETINRNEEILNKMLTTPSEGLIADVVQIRGGFGVADEIQNQVRLPAN